MEKLELVILVILFMKGISEELILIMQKLQRPASIIIKLTVDIQTPPLTDVHHVQLVETCTLYLPGVEPNTCLNVN